MIRRFPDIPDWAFDIDEKSAGVYEVVAKDTKGRTIRRTGTDPDRLIDECRREASDLRRKKNGG
ncbi:hypothetical protein [Thauera sp.]|uniref:hypothetical protein n=1 Tax=Thauera sp. TaxID=1905334 RepID=UPI002B5A76A6|nr:hypothetical protein [Thauera sp.]HRP24230.1 hypothetical protein [Thauera sp.]